MTTLDEIEGEILRSGVNQWSDTSRPSAARRNREVGGGPTTSDSYTAVLTNNVDISLSWSLVYSNPFAEVELDEAISHLQDMDEAGEVETVDVSVLWQGRVVERFDIYCVELEDKEKFLPQPVGLLSEVTGDGWGIFQFHLVVAGLIDGLTFGDSADVSDDSLRRYYREEWEWVPMFDEASHPLTEKEFLSVY